MKPKVLNPPRRIYLQVGEIDRDADFDQLSESGEVTWCTERQFSTDIEYVLPNRPKKRGMRRYRSR